MLRDLASKADNDVASAHVAWGLARRLVVANDVREARFACFRPIAFDAEQLHDLFDGTREIDLVDPAESENRVAIVADGSETSRVIVNRLGWRAVRGGMRRPQPSKPLPGVAPAPGPRVEPAYVPPPEPLAPPHPLQSLADEVADRLSVLGVAATGGVAIADRARPIAHHAYGKIELAGRDDRLIAIEAARVAGSPWAPAAIDALVAHVVTLLNVGLTEVTDAAEASALGRRLLQRSS
jgi:hypothetical protein